MERDLTKEISLICDQLAIGSRGCAEDQTTLINNEIGAILSLTPTVPALAIPHKFVEIQDRRPLPRVAIERCIEFIDQQIKQGNRVLIHCEMGISRSPTIGACYLYECEGISLEKAHQQIKTQHPVAEPHPALLASLMLYYNGNDDHELTRLSAPLVW